MEKFEKNFGMYGRITRKVNIYAIVFGTLFTPLMAQNYSSYQYMVSRRYGKCMLAHNYEGKDFSPNTLMRKYSCQVQENNRLGGLILKCRMPTGPSTLIFAQSQSACEKALRALQQL